MWVSHDTFDLKKALQVQVLPHGDAKDDGHLQEREVEQPRARTARHFRLRLVLRADLVLQITHHIHRLV